MPDAAPSVLISSIHWSNATTSNRCKRLLFPSAIGRTGHSILNVATLTPQYEAACVLVNNRAELAIHGLRTLATELDHALHVSCVYHIYVSACKLE